MEILGIVVLLERVADEDRDRLAGCSKLDRGTIYR
jgi:hypothetical protein